jgi:cation diffusion facilitator CzcD-associated flavoprotein CzcO
VSEPIIIVGTGFSGLGMAIGLKKAGIEDFVLLEKADEVGGTWRENTYPGCACDIMSLLYSYSFEPRTTWSRMYPRQEELLDYIKHCVDKYGLRPHIRFSTEAVKAEYDEERSTWRVWTGHGTVMEGRALISAMGPLHHPMIPELPGLADFEGKTFHSAQWHHDYDLAGKRVAVIGTGASAIQFIPQIAPKVAHLDVFQRTPPWILPKPDRALRSWERRLFERVPGTQRFYRTVIYFFQESAVLGFRNPRLMRLGESLAKRHLERQVPDPEMRRALTPDYTIGCKRTLVSSDYYPALTRDNVSLITDAIAAVDKDAIITADGTRHEVDAIIFGTGFHVTDAMSKVNVTGRGGLKLTDAWRDGVEAYLGMTVKDFPDLYFMIGPNTGLGHNSMIFMIEAQVRYILKCLRMGRPVAVRADVQDRFNRWVQRQSEGAVWIAGGCVSWYLDKEGKNRAAWPASTIRYWRQTRRPALADFEMEPQ